MQGAKYSSDFPGPTRDSSSVAAHSQEAPGWQHRPLSGLSDPPRTGHHPRVSWAKQCDPATTIDAPQPHLADEAVSFVSEGICLPNPDLDSRGHLLFMAPSGPVAASRGPDRWHRFSPGETESLGVAEGIAQRQGGAHSTPCSGHTACPPPRHSPARPRDKPSPTTSLVSFRSPPDF